MVIETTIHKIAIVGVLFGSAVVFGIASPSSARSQSIICCNQPVSVDGKWVGSTHAASCEEYARRNAKARMEICKMSCDEVKHAKELYCDKEDCKKNPKPPGRVYVGVPNAKIRKQPSEAGELSGSAYSGQTLHYGDVKRANGMTWYKINAPSHLAGWIKGDEVFCELPPSPPPPPPDHSCKKDLKAPGSLFVWSPKTVVGKVYSELTVDSKVIYSLPNTSRIQYREVRENKGVTWYYVNTPGYPPGWMKGSDLVCSRPNDSPPNMKVDPRIFQGTAALTSAFRG